MNSLSNIVYDIQTCLLNQANNALTVNAGLQHRSNLNITLGIVGKATGKKC